LKKSESLEVINLSKKFGTSFAVKNINFKFPRSGIFGLLGTNGAGKSTLIAMVLGLIKPSSGEVKILGEKFLDNQHSLLSRINFESPYVDLPKKLTVKQNLVFYARLYGMRDIFKHIHKLAIKLNIFDLLERNFGSLSAGQKTKVGLCKSLINNPELLLLDEPTASLDPETSLFVRNFLKSYQKENQIAIIIASHNMAEVESICERVVILKKGEIILDGSPNVLIKKNGCSNLEELFIRLEN
tara:strand:+ start:1358 stop:2083 length:726 start_codon:yes stop_codon:yes gene_type:complete